MQEFSSKNTSTNYVKLPAIYGKVNWNLLKGKLVFDYGCGNPTTQSNIKAFLKEKEVEYKGFDLYWDSDDYSNIHNSTLIVCANLLCVIKEDEIVQKIINVILANNKPFIIQVYEGDKTGIGKQTGPNQYQRNLRTKDYLNYFDWKGVDVIVYKGCIIRQRDKHLLQTNKSLE
jgi:hypothetical protein